MKCPFCESKVNYFGGYSEKWCPKCNVLWATNGLFSRNDKSPLPIPNRWANRCIVPDWNTVPVGALMVRIEIPE